MSKLPQTSQWDCLLRRHGMSPTQPRDVVTLTERARLVEQTVGPDPLPITAAEGQALRRRGRATLLTLHTEEVGSSGERYSAGRPTSSENNPYFRPVMARGRGYSHGIYHETFVASTTYRRAWSNIAEALTTGVWSVESATAPASERWRPDEEALAQAQADFVHACLFEHLEGGWPQFVREWLYQLIAGFTLFERVHYPFGHRLAGGIRRLAFRYPSSVRRWILDAHERDLVAVELARGDGTLYVLDAHDVLLDCWDRFGTNFEGISPLRTVTRWVELITLLVQLQGLAAEKYGVPWLTASRQSDSALQAGDGLRETLQTILDEALAEDAPVIALPDNTVVQLMSATGQMPDFTPAIELATQRVAEILKSEGSLVGLGSTGAYAARESAVGDLVRFAPYFGKLVANTLTGTNNTPYTGVIKTMIDARFGGPVRGLYPQLAFSVGQQRDTSRIEAINAGLGSGALSATADVEDAYRRELELKELPKIEMDQEGEEGADVASRSDEDLAKSALNGAQVTSMLEVALKVKLGELTVEQGVAVLERGFNVAPDVARRIVVPGAPPSPEPAAGAEASVMASALPAVTATEVIDPEREGERLDRHEQTMGRELRRVAIAHRKALREELDRMRRTNDVAPRRLGRLLSNMREEWVNRYTQAALFELVQAARSGTESIVRAATGGSVPTAHQARLSSDEQQRLEVAAVTIGTEAYQRMEGLARERAVEFANGDQTIGLELMAVATFAAIAAKGVSLAYNTGRESMIRRARQVLEAEGEAPRIMAWRSAVMDPGTCEPCRALDFDTSGRKYLVGSTAYDNIKPPAKCLGRHRCRCVMVYEGPATLDAIIARIARGQA